MKKNLLIGILLIVVVFLLGVLLFKKTTLNNQEILTENTTQTDNSNQNQVTSKTKPADIKQDLENIKTPLVIKSVYKKDNRWWADVDYVTQLDNFAYGKYIINTGHCVLPNMNKAQALAYLEKNGTEDKFFNSTEVSEGCYIDSGYDGGKIINENPRIRSFPFAQNFKTINYCPPEKNLLPTDYQALITNQPYQYGIYNTKGYFIKSGVITNSEISLFDFVNGCAG